MGWTISHDATRGSMQPSYTTVHNLSHDLYAPSVLEQAAALLTDLWAAGKRHGVDPGDWAAVTGLADASVDVVSHQHERAPEPTRTIAKIGSLQGHLVAALKDLGLTARLGGPGVIVARGPGTPRGGFHGDADVIVRIYSDGGWAFSFYQEGASVMPIVAPTSEAGASEVAEIVRAFVRGELANPFRR
jgi:hypothetical protein